MRGMASDGSHLDGHMDGDIDDSSPRSMPLTGAYDDGSPHGQGHVMFDDGISSVAESVDTNVTTSGNMGSVEVPREQKQFIRSRSNIDNV